MPRIGTNCSITKQVKAGARNALLQRQKIGAGLGFWALSWVVVLRLVAGAGSPPWAQEVAGRALCSLGIIPRGFLGWGNAESPAWLLFTSVQGWQRQPRDRKKPETLH